MTALCACLLNCPQTPDKVAAATATAVRNAVHLARLLAASPYPGDPGA